LLIYASASIPDSPVLATVIILIGAAVHVTGELRQAAGAFGIGYGLPPEHMQGQYQGVWSLGMSGAALIAPIVMTTLVLGGGMYGWSGLALVFLIAGFFVPRLVDSFLRQRARV
jgi:MFS family permease